MTRITPSGHGAQIHQCHQLATESPKQGQSSETSGSHVPEGCTKSLHPGRFHIDNFRNRGAMADPRGGPQHREANHSSTSKVRESANQSQQQSTSQVHAASGYTDSTRSKGRHCCAKSPCMQRIQASLHTSNLRLYNWREWSRS